MPYRRILRNALTMLIVVNLVSCAPSKGEQEVQGFVANYCSVLQDAYARADLKLLGQMATDKEVRKLAPVMQLLSETGQSMKTEILEFKVKKAKVTEDRATVRTFEKWRYWWIDRSGAITRAKKEESYDLQYNLLKVDGAWRVDSMKNLNE